MGFRLSPERLEELDEARVVLAIPVGEVKSARLLHGFVAERLVPSLVLAVLIAGAGLFCAVALTRALLGLSRLSRYIGAGIALIPLGLLLARSTLKRGWYLEIETQSERRKLDVMPCGMSVEQLREALKAVLGPAFLA